jgi:hypothetical protein
VGPRAGLDDVGERKFLTLPGLELRTLGYPARSQSLYRLHYPDSFFLVKSALCLVSHYNSSCEYSNVSLGLTKVGNFFTTCAIISFSRRTARWD